jgi:hypothetical protein
MTSLRKEQSNMFRTLKNEAQGKEKIVRQQLKETAQ